MAPSQLTVTEQEGTGGATRTTAWGPPPTATELDTALLRRDVKARLFGDPAPVAIGRYLVARRLGAGGMGIVYAARDPELGREVALKLVLPGHERGRERIVREARALAKLSHPNVVTIHEVGIHGDDVFVAMELVAGITLREWLATPRTSAAIAGVFRQAALGLDAAHHEGIVHRDFKPDNVLIGMLPSRGEHERVRVIDFGLALAEPEAESPSPQIDPQTALTRLSITGELVGTPGYMAREQILGEAVDARTDVFAFSVALFEALHERLPFDTSSIMALFEGVMRGPGELAFRRDLPRELVTLLRAGLDPDPARRPADLQPFIAVLARMESPPRRRGLMFGLAGAFVLGGVATVVGLAAASYDRYQRARAEVAAREAAVTIPAPLVCEPAASEEHVDCAALLDQLMQPGGVDDAAARCSFRRACTTPDATCPAGTTWDGTLGCATTSCSAVGLEAKDAACIAGNAGCCVAAANEHIVSERPADPAERRIVVADRWSRACANGDARACGELERIALGDGDRESAFAARITSCGLGNVQACRRIATLAEDREGVDDACVEEPSPSCFAEPPSRNQLLRMAECGGVVIEAPWAVVEESPTTLSAAFEAEHVVLAPGEAAAIDRAGESFRAAARERMTSLLVASGSEVAADESLPRIYDRLHDLAAQRGGLRRALQKVADVRAGLEPARPQTRAHLADDAMRTYAGLSDELEHALAAELGAARAAELRAQTRVWPGSMVATFIDACPRPS